MPTFEAITELEAEQIAYETAFLMQRGWKRIHRYDCEEYDHLSKEWSLRHPNLPSEFFWVKLGFVQSLCFYREHGYGSSQPVEIGFFSRNDAYQAEISLAPNEQIHEDR